MLVLKSSGAIVQGRGQKSPDLRPGHITLVITGEVGILIVPSEEEEPVGYGVPLGPSEPDWT